MQLTQIQKLVGQIELVSGLHIGGSSTEMHIGGTDNPVVKNPVTSEPYIPGSSLKGAIRTALLDRVNGGQRLRRVEDRKTGRERPENNQELQNRLFGYRAGRFEQDPMRLVQLGDAADVRAPEALGTEIRYAVNRKRHPVTKDGREIAAQAENLRQVVECIPSLRPRAFQGRLSLQELGGLTGPKVPAPELRWSFEELADACQAFYRPILERELQELGARGYLDATWRSSIQQILTAQEPAFSARRAFLLRVGFHSGAESVTLNGVRSIKIMMGKGQQPDYLPATKTVWLAAQDIQQRRDLVPFGWVLVEAGPHDSTPSARVTRPSARQPNVKHTKKPNGRRGWPRSPSRDGNSKRCARGWSRIGAPISGTRGANWPIGWWSCSRRRPTPGRRRTV